MGLRRELLVLLIANAVAASPAVPAENPIHTLVDRQIG